MKNSPFDLGNNDAYARWKEDKLKNYPSKLEDLQVEVNDPRKFSKIELEELMRRCRKTNMAIYVGKTGNNPDPEIPLSIGRQFGVHKIDKNWLAGDNSVSSLKLQENPKDKQLAPYTSNALNWHTDGYYNSNNEQIQSMMLHSVQSASKGGENKFFDHEIAYILLRDENPDHIISLMKNDVLTIPPRLNDGKLERNAVTGPVFRITKSGNLHMRYTIRKKNVIWSNNKSAESAKKALKKILDTNKSFVFKTILNPGSGLVSNNIIHARNSFVNNHLQKRHFYRSRYFERLNGTSALAN